MKKFWKGKARQPVSLETKVEDGEVSVLSEFLEGLEDLPDEQIKKKLSKKKKKQLSIFRKLPDLQYKVLRMRNGIYDDEPWFYNDIPRELGISYQRVRNLEEDGWKGLRRLGYTIGKAGWRKRTKKEKRKEKKIAQDSFFYGTISDLVGFFGLIVIIAIVLGYFILYFF